MQYTHYSCAQNIIDNYIQSYMRLLIANINVFFILFLLHSMRSYQTSLTNYENKIPSVIVGHLGKRSTY